MKANDTAAAREMWAAIAAGTLSDTEALEWCREVAGRIVHDVFDAKFDRTSERAEAAQKAIGFYGRPIKDKELRADLAFVSHLPRKEALEIALLYTRDSEFVQLSEQQALKKIDRLRGRS